jgi:hypothetical protein
MLLFCVAILLVTLSYVTKTLLDFQKITTQVHCEQSTDFVKCSQEFKEKTSKLMKEL